MFPRLWVIAVAVVVYAARYSAAYTSGRPQKNWPTSYEQWLSNQYYRSQEQKQATRRPLREKHVTASPPTNSIIPSRAPNGTLVPFVVASAESPRPTEEPSHSRDTIEDRIIFPTEMETLTRQDLQYTKPPVMNNRFGNHGAEDTFVPKGCVDGIICDSVEYPEDHVNRIVASNMVFQYSDIYGDDIVPEVAQRVDYADDQPLCQSKELIIYPKVGQTKDNNWAYIINNANFSQAVRVEQCLHENQPCAMTENFPYGYTTSCKQKYLYRHLMALNERGEQVKDVFRLPACCKCVMKSTSFGSGIWSRSGSDSSSGDSSTTETATAGSR